MELQDIVRRLRMEQSIKAIKRETGKHRRVIRKVLELAEQEGWLEAERELPSEAQLQGVYHEQRAGEEGRSHPLDERRDQIKEWREEGLWRDNQDENRATIRMRIDVATRPRVT